MTAGIIKGSEQTLTSTTGYLDSATYFDLSHRTAGTFASHREEIYRLFEAYLRLKKEYRGTDAPDRYVHILSHLHRMKVERHTYLVVRKSSFI